MKLPVFVVGLLCAANCAFAADWIAVGSEGKHAVYGDLESRTANRAWFDRTHAPTKKYLFNQHFSERILEEADCGNRLIRVVYATRHDKTGRIIDSRGADTQWQHVIPDTFGEAAFHFICTHYPL